MEILAEKAPASLPALRVGDHLALDFLNSIAGPHGTWYEWIGDGPAFMLWLEQVGMITPDERKRATETLSSRQLDHLAAEARDLREWFRGLLARVKEHGVQTVDEKDVDRLNSYLAVSAVSQYLQRTKDLRLELVPRKDLAEPKAFLALVAESIAELLCEESLNLVSRCGSPICSIWFYDRTKSRRRRWCSKAVCGNRAHVTAFRQRTRDVS